MAPGSAVRFLILVSCMLLHASVWAQVDSGLHFSGFYYGTNPEPSLVEQVMAAQMREVERRRIDALIAPTPEPSIYPIEIRNPPPTLDGVNWKSYDGRF